MLEVLYMLTPDFCTYLLLVFDLILVPTFVTFLQDIDSPYEVSIEPVLSINDKNFHLVPDRFLINNSRIPSISLHFPIVNWAFS